MQKANFRDSPEVLHEAVDVVRLCQGDLEAHGPRDVARQAGQALLSRTTDADEEGRPSRHLDEAVEPQKVSQSIVEEDQFKLKQNVPERGRG